MTQTSSETITVAPMMTVEYANRYSSNTFDRAFWRQSDPNATVEVKGEKEDYSPIPQIKNDILGVILNDTFEDGFVTKSEEYIRETFNPDTGEDIKTAIMELYLSNLDRPFVLTGLLTMVSSIPYHDAVPQCPIMALGLLQNKDISIRDKAIQVFEKWNSKAGIPVLKSLKCDRKWLQKYVDKVILYLERDGLD